MLAPRADTYPGLADTPLWTYPPPIGVPLSRGEGGALHATTLHTMSDCHTRILSHAYIVTRIYIIWYNRNGISTMGGELKMGFSTTGGGNIEKNETFFLVFRILGYEKMVVNNFFWDFLAIIGKLVVLLHLEK